MPDILFDVIDEGMTVDVIVENPVVDVGVDEQIVSIITVEGPAGPPGSGIQVLGETPVGAKDGVNTVFTTSGNYRANTIAVYLNGLREFFYAETAARQITLEDPPHAGDTLHVDYVI